MAGIFFAQNALESVLVTWMSIGILLSIFVGIPLAFFVFSVASRRSYRCPQCGERITTEYLKAKHCNLCGAPLQETEPE